MGQTERQRLPLTPYQKRAIAAAVIAGGSLYGASRLHSVVLHAQRVQRDICSDVQDRAGRVRQPKVAVDGLFFKRLLKILKICVPSATSAEAGLICGQGVLLVSRTLLTDYIARLEGSCGRYLISQDFDRFVKLIIAFAGVAVPAAMVNAGLKYMQKRIQLAFMRRLTHNLHSLYCSNRAYYAASVLGGLTNADQRITEDVEKFAFSISELYGYTFKPLLDVILFSRSLASIMGYRAQFALYGYYLLSALLLRAVAPPLALITAQETGLSGALRAAHQRLVNNAEEVAFNDPPAGTAEKLILNRHLTNMLRHARLSALQRFFQQVIDGYFVKYFASCVALLVYAAPIYFRDPRLRGTRDSITQDYIRAMRLLQNTSRGIGDLILVYKRVTSLAGHTSRVSELLEQVTRLGTEDRGFSKRELYLRNVSSHSLDKEVQDEEELPEPQRSSGEIIAFRRVALNAPDGTPLVRELSFEVPPGRCIMIMGPNGCGKSSLFRVLAGLWPLLGGDVQTPGRGSMFYLSQRPYLVAGSLRDQLTYPFPPANVAGELGRRDAGCFEHLPSRTVPPDELDARLEAALEAVELEYLLGRGRGWEQTQHWGETLSGREKQRMARGRGWEQTQNWGETLSGGEKQRLAMARLLFHSPTYAILDECTSAVSADGEMLLYKALVKAGITLLSIAHRPALKRFHHAIVHFDGAQEGEGWHMEELDT